MGPISTQKVKLAKSTQNQGTGLKFVFGGEGGVGTAPSAPRGSAPRWTGVGDISHD